MTAKEFNKKYKDFLEEGHYGLAIDIPEIVEFLDSIFEDLIRIPGFKYFQIKVKFGYARFYAEGISFDITHTVEARLNELLKAYENDKIQRR